MQKTEKRSGRQGGVTYELRTLTDRWVQPMGGDVISTHGSADAAHDAYERQQQAADDGTGRTTYGSYVPNIVVRVNGDGTQSVAVPRDRPKYRAERR